MKKIILGVILITSIFILTGCNNNDYELVEVDANDILNSDSTDVTDSKILVVYFSRTGENYNVGNVEVGNTAIMASYIKEYLHADSFEIVPINKYPESYSECLEIATEEKNTDARPEIEDKIDNFSEYETIFLGYPIWYGDYPMIINTFLEEYDFTGKNVIPFNTHEGSGSSGTYESIKNKLTTASVNTNGLPLQGKVARTEEGKTKTIEWLKELGY